VPNDSHLTSLIQCWQQLWNISRSYSLLEDTPLCISCICISVIKLYIIREASQTDGQKVATLRQGRRGRMRI